MAGPANATWSAKRVAGFQDQVKAKYPNLQIVATPTSLVDPSEALNKLQNALQAHPNIKWLASVDYSLPVPQSVPAQAKGLPYATMGFDPNTKAAIIDGLLASTLPTDAYYMGYVGVSEVVSLLNGEKPTGLTACPFPQSRNKTSTIPSRSVSFIPRATTLKLTEQFETQLSTYEFSGKRSFL